MNISKVFSLFFITMLLCIVTACSDSNDNESANRLDINNTSSDSGGGNTGSVLGSSNSGSSSGSSSSSDSSNNDGSSGNSESEEDDEPLSLQEVNNNLAYATGYAAYTAVKYCNYKYSSYCNDIDTANILESVKNAVDDAINNGNNSENTYITLFNNAQKLFVETQNDLIDLYVAEDYEKITYSETTSISDATKAIYETSDQVFLTILYNNITDINISVANYVSIVGMNISKAIGNADIYDHIENAISNAGYVINSLYNIQ